MNLKRESKAYSYKDQLEELQLRRELEEKRRREGKHKEVPLSAKQKEAIKAQMAKESAIRQRLTAVCHLQGSGGKVSLRGHNVVSMNTPRSHGCLLGLLEILSVE